MNLARESGWNPLTSAVNKGELDMVKLLVESGASPDIWNPKGRTALADAIHMDRIDIVKILIKAGANLNFRNKKGVRAIEIAVKKKKALK